jgi:hypothetical protein
MHRKITLLGIVVSLASAVWWYYPALQDMRDTSHRVEKCKALWARLDSGGNDVTVVEAEFFAENCRR